MAVSVLDWIIAGGLLDVERRLFGVDLRYPLAVASALGRYLRTALDVRPGHVVKNLWSMACVQVAIVGLKHARCKNLMSITFVFCS